MITLSLHRRNPRSPCVGIDGYFDRGDVTSLSLLLKVLQGKKAWRDCWSLSVTLLSTQRRTLLVCVQLLSSLWAEPEWGAAGPDLGLPGLHQHFTSSKHPERPLALLLCLCSSLRSLLKILTALAFKLLTLLEKETSLL